MSDLELITKPDAAMALKRMEHWWEREIIGRPAIQVTAPRTERKALPQSKHASQRDRWMDIDFTLQVASTQIENTYYAGEAMPIFWSNLGPEILSTAYGAELEFGPDTSWSIPCLKDYSVVDDLSFSTDNVYFDTVLEATRRALLEGQGKYLVGITDLHPGADLAASLRDPQQLCLDLLDAPEDLARLLAVTYSAFFEAYAVQEKIIKDAGQETATSWLGVYSRGRCYIPSCDFSAMISPRAFNKFFLPEILDEIDWLDRSIYHLDGPAAVRHLDTLLEIPNLDAIQFVQGAGRKASSFMEVYQKIQKHGKSLHVSVDSDEVDTFIDALSPDGVMLSTWAASEEEADFIVNKTLKW